MVVIGAAGASPDAAIFTVGGVLHGGHHAGSGRRLLALQESGPKRLLRPTAVSGWLAQKVRKSLPYLATTLEFPAQRGSTRPGRVSSSGSLGCGSSACRDTKKRGPRCIVYSTNIGHGSLQKHFHDG